MKIHTIILLIVSIYFSYIPYNFSQEKETTWEIKNLSINDKGSNLGATFYGNKMIFSSMVGGKYHMYSGILTNGDVKSKTLFLEAKTHENTSTFTNDLQTMYFTRSLYGEENTRKYNKNIASRIAIFKATKLGLTWSNITTLPFNSVNYDVGHPTISANNKKLYFSSNKKGTLGKSDIFVVDILGNNTYSEPKNLGKKINTRGNELYPSITKDNILYFSSNGHKGLGKLDVFSIDLNDPTAKVIHLKAPINSKFDDFAFNYDAINNIGYYTSNRPGGKGSDDIYSFTKKEVEEEEEEPAVSDQDCMQQLKGTVYLNATQKIIPVALISLKNENEEIVQKMTTDESGKFGFSLKCSTSYKVEASKQGYKTSEQIMVTNSKNGILARKNIFLTTKKEVLAQVEKMRVGTVGFDYNEIILQKRYMYQLDKAIIMMKDNPKLLIHFESHTDSRAETDFNMQLSVERIEVLKEYIGFKGIFRKRFSGTAFGETKPINRCTKEVECTEREYLINRRTTFVLTEK